MKKSIKLEILDYPIVRTLEPIYYKHYKVHAGFITDGASVPSFLHWLLPPFCRYGRAAILHDYHYRCKKFDRKEADDVFRDFMVDLEVHSWKIFLIYYSIRIWGGYFRKRGPSQRLKGYLRMDIEQKLTKINESH